MKFYSKYGRICRYKFADKVKYLYDDKIYFVINAIWIGNSNGFWEVILEDKYGNQHSCLKSGRLRKVK